MIYLDYAAATPVDERVLAVMQPFYKELFFNPSARYQPAKEARRKLEDARAIVASQLGCRSEEVIFTAGGTEANNLAIQGIMSKYPDKNCLITEIEHDSVWLPAQQYHVKTVPVRPNGIVSVDELEAMIDEDTVLISVIHASNEIGTIQPLRKITRVVERLRQERKKNSNATPLYVHTDACQSPNYLDVHVNSLGVDLMTLNGGKIYGPKQSGCLFVHRSVQLRPLIHGGGQENGLRSGTENVAQAVGFARALESAQAERSIHSENSKQLQQQFFDGLKDLPKNTTVNGSKKNRLPNNVHITIVGAQNERLLLQLEQEGILAAAGSACSARENEKSSRTLLAIGRSDEEAHSSVRFSLGKTTSSQDITATLEVLRRLLPRVHT